MSTFEVKTQAEIDALSLGAGAKGRAYFNDTTSSIVAWDGSNWRAYANDGFPVSSTHSLAFDGTDDFVDISNASGLLNSRTAFTISFWYKTTASSDAGRMIASGTASTNRINISLSGTNLYFSGGDSYSINATQPSVNTWHHVIAQREGINGAIYVDGGTTPFASGSEFPSTSTSNQAENLSIGRIPFGSAGYFNGFIDEVAIFTRALTEAERTSIYNNHIYNNPSALWLFNNNSNDFNGVYNATLENGLGYSPDNRP